MIKPLGPNGTGELGITNLGLIPQGMTLVQALRTTRDLRRFTIDPEKESGRLTLCETQREVWRTAERLPEPERSELRELAAAAYDFGKRMDARMRSLRERCVANGIGVEE